MRPDFDKYLKEHPDFVQRWYKENIGKERLEKWLEDHERPTAPRDVTDDHDQEKKPAETFVYSVPVINDMQDKQENAILSQSDTVSEKLKVKTVLSKNLEDLKNMSEKDQFLELIRDIANELDVNLLCHKILRNVSYLTNSDKGSLFLARGPKDRRYLVPVLFDVSEGVDIGRALVKEENQFRIPFGSGIAGSVAKTKTAINIQDAYKDYRFNKDVDKRTGYKTKSLLCMPIFDYDGELLGVAQIMNKKDDNDQVLETGFGPEDEEVFRNYVSFCGIGLANAQLFEMSVQEYKRNQHLLKLAHNIFEEQGNLDQLLLKIMIDAKNLIKCERCRIYLIEDTHKENAEAILKLQTQQKEKLIEEEHTFTSIKDVLFTKAFELQAEGDNILVHPDLQILQNSSLGAIAKQVAVSKGIMTIEDVATHPQYASLLNTDNFEVKCVLNLPIYNGSKNVIGIIQLINRTTKQQQFTEMDINIVQAFSIFCGLGVHNCQMYESAYKLMAKQSIALEVLSYHASGTNEDTNKLKTAVIHRASDFKIYTWEFDDLFMSDDDTCKASLRMFLECDVVNNFRVPYEVLCRWILSVRKNYRPVTYHNWRHGFNVAQSMFTMIFTGKMDRVLDDLEIFCLLVACFCHDLDHRGTNNAFQSKADSPLAMLYSSSTMEHHHFDQCVMILNSEGNNILQHLSPEMYRKAMDIIKNAIISTDLALYFKKKGDFQNYVDSGETEWQDPEAKNILRGMMMTGCDVSAICKPWEVQFRVAHLVAGEFFEQGDVERAKLGLEPMAMMDRQKKDELPKMQVGFINFICIPVYSTLAKLEPKLKPLLDGCLKNRDQWQKLADKAEIERKKEEEKRAKEERENEENQDE